MWHTPPFHHGVFECYTPPRWLPWNFAKCVMWECADSLGGIAGARGAQRAMAAHSLRTCKHRSALQNLRVSCFGWLSAPNAFVAGSHCASIELRKLPSGRHTGGRSLL